MSSVAYKSCSPYRLISVEPLTPHIGAIIGGIDLTHAVTDEQIAEVRAALLAHGVVFFRDQPIDLPTHKAFALRFGAVHVHSARKGLDEHPEVRPIHAE